MEVIGRVLNSSRRRPAVIHVVAGPGLGKTRLLGEICERADSLGMLVLRGLGEGHRSGRIFGALAEPFATFVADTDETGRSPADASDPDLLRLARLADGADGETEDVGARVVTEQVRRVLTTLTRTGPVVLVLDDVQWSDEGTLDVLTSLSRHPPRGGVVVVLSYRPLPGLGAFADVRPGRIEGPVVGALHRFELAALTEPQVTDLLPDVAPARRRALFAACGGNPFYLQAVAAAGGDIVLDEQAGDRLPTAVRTALAAELDALDPTTRRIADNCRRRWRPARPGPRRPGRRPPDDRRP